MARYIGSKCKICRALNYSVCGSVHCALRKRETRPGMHPVVRTKMSEYKKRLLEKQKLRFSYWLSEEQFRNYIKKAMGAAGKTGENLLSLLERRLDNIIYRLGFASTSLVARQLVVHGHIMVNGKKVDKPSYLLKMGDVVSVRGNTKEMISIKEGLERSEARPKPSYLEVDKTQLEGRLVSIPRRDEIPVDIDESLVVEYYAKYI